MCGFIVSKGQGNDKFIRRRGQDFISTYRRDGLTFAHYLLHCTGELTPEPFIDGDVVALYNGEIYNLPFVHSDGENIIRSYLGSGRDPMFPMYLDGEFALALYDFGTDTAYFATDRFGTKPIWRNGAECASYQSGVGGIKIAANTVEVVRISTGEHLSTMHYHSWDWRQTVDSYDDCIEAFVAAVHKRYQRGCFIGLSSGYDSGAIACALRGLDFKAYSVFASENRGIVMDRVNLLGECEVITDFDQQEHERHLRENAEEFRYRIRYDDGWHSSDYKDDYASLALSYICSLAHKEGRKILLSGCGGDEILSDYSLIPRQSELKGVFPPDLKPWTNFTRSCMESYLGKEECVGGSWAIETRYPFLDTAFVQSFLSLKAELKNRHYKAPIYEYLMREGFPFENGRKVGFSIPKVAAHV